MKNKLTNTGMIALVISFSTPAIIWAGSTIVNHEKAIAMLQESDRNIKEHIIETKEDVKFIREYLIKQGE